MRRLLLGFDFTVSENRQGSMKQFRRHRVRKVEYMIYYPLICTRLEVADGS
ncbi:hypothetical protein HNQ54_003504 [Anaerocolumna cellulosilytica]|nr:hypothetical protein [Anaerocolumna cellulosilytica]